MYRSFATTLVRCRSTAGGPSIERGEEVAVASMRTRRAVLGGLALAAMSVPLFASPAAAVNFTSITIRGEGLPTPLEVRNDADPELFNGLLSQVGWLANRAGQAARPAPDKAGPKYTVIVYVKDKAKQQYDLYPLAAGGPRVFRPAKQPDRRATTSAWFFGRLNMSETLRGAGVPLPQRPDALGGAGGGEEAAEEAVFAPMDELRLVFAQWKRLFLLNGAVVLLIAAGLAGFSLLIRPKT